MRWTRPLVGCGRRAGPPREHPGCGEDDAELDGRDLIADRLGDEVSWLRPAAGWLTRLHAGEYPPAVNPRPGGDWPGTANVAAGLARAAAVPGRIAGDAGELARARRAGELAIAAVLPGRGAGRWRRLAGPDLDFGAFCRAPADARLHAGADGTSPGCVAGRAVPPGGRAAARLHRQPVRRALTTPSAGTLKRGIAVRETGRRSGAGGSVVTGARLDVRDLARIPGGHLGAGLPKLLRAVVLRPCEGAHRDAPVKQQPGHPAAPRTRPAARGAGHQHKPAHESTPQRPRRLAHQHYIQ